jgi:NADPH:quinone reductase
MQVTPAMRMTSSRIKEGENTLILAPQELPMPGAGEVRIKVSACGINYPDVLMLEGRYQFPMPDPFVPGIEIAGVIDAVGEGVSTLAPGIRVAAQVDHGGLAHYALANAERTYALPDSLDEIDAAASLLTYGTSFHALRDRAALQAGERLLVLGAGGGVGLAAVALGKWMGAHVIAGASSPTKLDLARAAGADETFLYPMQPDSPKALAALIKQSCPNGVDVIYDPVGGDHSEAALRSIRPGGRYLVVGFPGGIARLPLNLVLLKNCAVVGVFWGDSQNRWPQASRALIGELLELLAQSAVVCSATTLFRLEEAGQAIAALKDRTANGKIVVSLNADTTINGPQRLYNEDLT